MSPSASSIQLHAVQKIAKFIPVVESATVTPRTSTDNLCASISSQSGMNDCTLKELEAAISASLSITDKHALLNTLLEFPDVISDGLIIIIIYLITNSHQLKLQKLKYKNKYI